jgi:hypothetical protein
VFEPAGAAMTLQRHTEMVWTHLHAEFPGEIIANIFS